MEPGSLEELEEALKAFANINRLRLLLELQEPRGYNEIELTPSRTRGDQQPLRPISRQAVRGHIEQLRDIGVVREAGDDGRRRRFEVDRARLFAIVERLRALATDIPDPDDPPNGSGPTEETPWYDVDGPHLALVRGVQEGRVFRVGGQGEKERFVIGCNPDADVRLTYDFQAAPEHAVVYREEDDLLLENRSGPSHVTRLNWRRIEPHRSVELSPGDLIGVGMTQLVFRA